MRSSPAPKGWAAAGTRPRLRAVDGPNGIPAEWRPSLAAAVGKPTVELTEDELLDTLFWLAREVCKAMSPEVLGLPFAGAPISAEGVEIMRSVWFDAHLVGLVEIADELYAKRPDLRLVPADWRKTLRHELATSRPAPPR